MNRVKPPYNVSGIAQRAVIDAMRGADSVNQWVAEILDQRERLAGELAEFGFVEKVYPSDANFLLVRVSNARSVYRHLVGENIVVRDRSTVWLCDECLRITVGTPSENDRLIEALSRFEGK
jgi:histidinol-phosphate aminotransferase